MNGFAVSAAALAMALLVWPSGLPRAVAGGARSGRRQELSDLGQHRRLLRGRPSRTGRPRKAAFAAALLAIAAAAQLVPWQLTAAAALAGATAFNLLRRARASARARRDMDGLIAALRGLVRELRAGAGPIAAANQVRVGAAPAARGVLDLLAEQHWVTGATGGGGVTGAESALPAAVVAQIRQAWAVSTSYGIPLVAVLTACIDDLDDRRALARIRAQHVAGPAVSGYVLAALPVAGIAMGAGLGSQPIDVLLGGTLGGALLVVGVGLCCAGLLWTSGIVRGGGDV